MSVNPLWCCHRFGHDTLDHPRPNDHAPGALRRHVKPKHPAIDRPSDACQAHATDSGPATPVKPTPPTSGPATPVKPTPPTSGPATPVKPTPPTSGPATPPPGLRGLSIAIDNVAAQKPQANSNALTALQNASARGSSTSSLLVPAFSLNLH